MTFESDSAVPKVVEVRVGAVSTPTKSSPLKNHLCLKRQPIMLVYATMLICLIMISA